ncbi:MAG: AAA family ATPase [Verrucomicrobiales bacterium]|nr:AAA family ATPase [Verrucomicrobiales bacterium]
MTLEDHIQSARFCILIGKNGSGKSTLLRRLDDSPDFESGYISPERGGVLRYEPGVEQSISTSKNWLDSRRRRNRIENFREMSASQFRSLEMHVLRAIEREQEKRADLEFSFETILEKINSLLDQIKIVRGSQGFDIQDLNGGNRSPEQVSSGEAELVVLAIEILHFGYNKKKGAVLLLDEPDVHLHPDLQQRLVGFLEGEAIEHDFRVVIATHSTAITGAISRRSEARIIPITTMEQTEFDFFEYRDICNEILPIFGAHPLSSQFSKSPVLLVEGEDDNRVFDQFVRSSGGRVSFSPAVVGNVDEMNRWEKWLESFLPAIYDNPVAYSLRDGDASPDSAIENVGCVRRFRLRCYSIENVLLTEECLQLHEFSEDQFKQALKHWTHQFSEHPQNAEMVQLIENFSDRRKLKIKDLRNILIMLLKTNKPWEVVVGRLIADTQDIGDSREHSLVSYLGSSFYAVLQGR